MRHVIASLILLLVGCATHPPTSTADHTRITVPVTVLAGSLVQYGFREPYIDIEAGATLESKRAIAQAHVSYSPTPKIQIGDGYSLGYGVTDYLRHKNVVAGMGIGDQLTINSQWRKRARRYSLKGGIWSNNWHILLSREYPLKDINHLKGWDLLVETHLINHVWLVHEVVRSKFDNTTTNRATGYLFGFKWSN